MKAMRIPKEAQTSDKNAPSVFSFLGLLTALGAFKLAAGGGSS